MTATQGRSHTSAPTDGSRTITLLDSQPRPEDDVGPSSDSIVGALRLRGEPRRTRQRVVWDEDVIDNEGCGKKKSKSTYFQPWILAMLTNVPFSLLYIPQASAIR
jgi:protein phosphatase 1 regulatory subunit 11